MLTTHNKPFVSIVSVLFALISMTACGQPENSESEIRRPQSAPGLELDSSALRVGWEDHDWGDFQSDVLGHYSDVERYLETGRFEGYDTGEFRMFAGEVMPVRLSFADARFYGITLHMPDTSERTFGAFETEIYGRLGPASETYSLTKSAYDPENGMRDEVNGIGKKWRLGPTEISLERNFDSNYMWLIIDNEDVKMRRGKWAQ